MAWSTFCTICNFITCIFSREDYHVYESTDDHMFYETTIFSAISKAKELSFEHKRCLDIHILKYFQIYFPVYNPFTV